jgi:transcription-repair coupling factor (superfamily II helicase)
MMEDLGSGFYLAMHDLEIRGAGEVLGESSRARSSRSASACTPRCSSARCGPAGRQGARPDAAAGGHLGDQPARAPALLPTDYCPDVQERLTLYKRLANCDSEDDLRALQEELIDRFGEMPAADPGALIETHRLRSSS